MQDRSLWHTTQYLLPS